MDVEHSTLHESLLEMDELFDGFFEWLAAQYDPESGGFYYAPSSRKIVDQIPDIESTAQALNILERCGLLTHMPQRMKDRLIAFFQNKQDPKTGYFYDDHPHMKEDEVMVARAIHYSLGALRKLGGKALHRLPLNAQAAPDYMKTPETYLEWLRSVSLVNSWRGCDRLATSNAYLLQLSETERGRYLDAALRFFGDIQDPATGLWGEGTAYVRISGTFKLHTFYNSFRIPLPKANEIVRSIQHCLRHEVAQDMCYIRNPIHLLSYIKPDLSKNDWAELVRITLDNMRQLKRADGGFSRELGHSPTAPNVAQVKTGEVYPSMPKPVHIGLGLVEGDMNAGTQAVLIRSLCYRLSGSEAPQLRQTDHFFKNISW